MQATVLDPVRTEPAVSFPLDLPFDFRRPLPGLWLRHCPRSLSDPTDAPAP